MLLSALTWIPPCWQLDCYRYRYVAGIRAGSPHATFEQAKDAAMALLKGDPDR